MQHAEWPALPYDEWHDTYATVHLWSQIVGKVALALAPPINHCWGSALQVTPHGLVTRPLPLEERTFTIEFDFVDHQLTIRVSDGAVRTVPLVPKTVADFYTTLMETLRDLGLAVKIWPVAVELPTPIRLDSDVEHHAYDREQIQRFWTVILNVHRIFSGCRTEFIGKCSPVHFFWGSFDLAVTRFSGRAAPPREGPEFMCDAYSHEVVSHGFWPGSGLMLEPAFYAYAVPEPEGMKEAKIEPQAAFYHREMGEFILPYDAVRLSRTPEADLTAFVRSTYAQAATLGKWDPALVRGAAH
jgi:hypothetical protein